MLKAIYTSEITTIIDGCLSFISCLNQFNCNLQASQHVTAQHWPACFKLKLANHPMVNIHPYIAAV
jgi:hypothetical protein